MQSGVHGRKKKMCFVLNMKQYTHLCCSGGGYNGMMHIGAFAAMEHHLGGADKFCQYMRGVKGFAGTSVGAIAALALSLRLNASDMREALNEIINAPHQIAPKLDLGRFITDYGFDDGESAKQQIRSVLRKAGLSETTTLSDIRRLLGVDFVCCSTNLNTQLPVYFGPDSTPDMHVADAVFMSMCVPFLYAPVLYDGCFFVDGSITQNVPRCFNDCATLYFNINLDGRQTSIHKWPDYIESIVLTSMGNQWTPPATDTVSLRMPTYLAKETTIAASRYVSSGKMKRIVACGYASFVSFSHPRYILTLRTAIQFSLLVVTQHHLDAKTGSDGELAYEDDQCIETA